MEEQQQVRQPLLVSRHAAAESLGICLRTLDKFVATKVLSCRRVGRRVLIPRSALIAFARRDHPTALEPEPDSADSCEVVVVAGRSR